MCRGYAVRCNFATAVRKECRQHRQVGLDSSCAGWAVNAIGEGLKGSHRVDWQAVKFMTAWRAGFKLGKSIIAFQFPKPVRKRDSSSKSGTGTPRGTTSDSLPAAPDISLDETTTASSAAGSDNPRAHTEATTPNPSYSEDLRYGEAAASKQLACEAEIDQ